MSKNVDDVKKDFRDWSFKHQYSIPARLSYLADKYPTITWKDAQLLYKTSVKEILNEFQIDNIVDVEYGRGFKMTEKIFIEKLERWEK